MLKGKMNDNPVIYIHITEYDKKRLKEQAEKLGMQMTTYCRMVLLKSLEGIK